MTARLRVDDRLPAQVPEGVRLLGLCAAAGVATPGGVLVVDDSPGTDVEVAARLGPLPRGRVELVALGAGRAAGVVSGLPAEDVRALAAGLRTAFSLGGPVLAQPAVRAIHAGRVELRAGRSSDRVLAVEGAAHEVEASAEVRSLDMPVLVRRRQRAHRGSDEWRTPLPPWAMRLARELRSARRVLPARDLDVEFADDGQVCRLLRVWPAS